MVRTVVGLMGSSPHGGSASLSTPAQVSSFLQVCKKFGVEELDTARVYNGGKSEETLGQLPERKEFIVATKAPSFSPGSLTYDKIVDNCNKSLETLHMDKVDIYYLHGPDTATPLEERCRAIGQLYKEGKFDRFGISNLKDEVVTEIYEICQREGYVMPTVYQGGYNAIHRKSESTLLPLLRKYKIQYYAWGPLAGGALAKNIEDILNPKEGSRYQALPVMKDLFLKPKLVEGIRRMTSICQENGLTLLEASLRWIKHHSVLGDDDAFILGASTNEQLETGLKASQAGPLDDKMVKAFDELWNTIKDDAPPYA